jgi:hypothetical protein
MKPLLSYLLAEGCDENDPRLFVGVVQEGIEDDGCECGVFLAMALELYRLLDEGHVTGKYHEWLQRMEPSIDWLAWIRSGMVGWHEAKTKAERSGTLEALLSCRTHWLREEALARKAMARALDRAKYAVANIELVDELLTIGPKP